MNENGKYQIPEAFVSGNRPVHFYTTSDGRKVELELLPCDQSEAWARKTRALEDVQQEIIVLYAHYKALQVALEKPLLPDDIAKVEASMKENAAKREELNASRFDLVKELLGEYNPSVFTPETVKASSVVQLVATFQRLRTFSDPLLADGAIASEYQAETARLRAETAERIRNSQEGG